LYLFLYCCWLLNFGFFLLGTQCCWNDTRASFALFLWFGNSGDSDSDSIGDCLSIGASALLERLGVLHRITAGPHATLRGWQIVAPNGSAFEAAFDDCAIAAERSVLDAVLVDASLAAGARLERFAVTDVERDARGHVCGVRSREGVRTARLTVGADGLRSIVAQRLGALPRHGSLRKLSLTFHARVDGVGSVGEMHVGDGVCVGIAPVAGGKRCNLTVVADSDRFGRAVADDPRAFARAVLHNLPRTCGRRSCRISSTTASG
jgi:2-polyprenyl-6-methoxyphenol hydroxylase-like FAD-dependent oxidoreductase